MILLIACERLEEDRRVLSSSELNLILWKREEASDIYEGVISGIGEDQDKEALGKQSPTLFLNQSTFS